MNLPQKWIRPAIPALTAAVTFAVFLPSLRNGFLTWDDALSLFGNVNYRGLGPEQLRWMFTSFPLGPYTPLAWMSLGFDYCVWGMKPFGYHLTSVVLHSLNALVFYFLCRKLLALAAGPFPAEKEKELSLAAAFAALFFAINPLRVEPVAWISGRHDVLACLFYMLAVLWYTAQYCAGRERTPFRRRLLPALAAFLLALLSKGMAISLPVALIVLDVYPLKRLPGPQGRWFCRETRQVWLEKVPFFLLALVFGAVGYAGQLRAGSLSTFQEFGVSYRCAQVLFGTAFCVWKTLLPLKLLPLYRLPEGAGLLNWQPLLSGTLVAAITASVIAARRRWPAGLAVWLCYLAALAPVSGIVKINTQSAADRYTYIACLGFAVLAGAGFLAGRRAAGGRFKNLCLALACLVLAALGHLTWNQQKVWRDSETLFRYALSVDPQLDYAHNNLALELNRQKKTDEAIHHYEEALRINPRFAPAHKNLGAILAARGRPDQAVEHYIEARRLAPEHKETTLEQCGILAALGRFDEALKQCQEALKLTPNDARVHNNTGLVLAAQGRPDAAAGHYREALKIDPGFAQAHNNLAAALNQQGRFEEAVAHYLKAVKLKPDYAEAYYNLGQNLAALGRFDEAVTHYRAALKIKPGLALAHNNLGTALSALGRLDEAVGEYQEALRLRPDLAVAHYSLGAVLYKQGKLEQSGGQYEAALTLDPEYAEAHYNLSYVLYRQGKREQALEHYRKAIKLAPALGSAAAQGQR